MSGPYYDSDYIGRKVTVRDGDLQYKTRCDSGQGGTSSHSISVRFDASSAIIHIGCTEITLDAWLLLRKKVQRAVGDGI